MKTTTVQNAAVALSGSLVPWMPLMERRVLRSTLRGEEGTAIAATVLGVLKTIEDMPVTYGQDGLGDEAVVHLHYFRGGSDWWITEKDVDGGVDQAYGFVCLNGDTECAESGYISIAELVENDVELDLYWTPKTLSTVKRKLGL